MPTPMKPTLTATPPLVFRAMLYAALDRSDRQRRESAPCNDGRTGYIIRY